MKCQSMKMAIISRSVGNSGNVERNDVSAENGGEIRKYERK
jgi:hypothetical protein